MTAAGVGVALVRVAAGAHFLQLPAMLLGPRLVKELSFADELAALGPLGARIVRVMALGIMLCVFGLGVVVLLAAESVARGGRLGAGLAIFLGSFWSWRALVQLRVYARLWPSSALGRLTHVGLCLLFTGQGAAFFAVAVIGLWRP
jgi:hypothetical protein